MRQNILSRNPLALVVLVLAAIVSIFAVTKVLSQPTTKILYLKPDQESAIVKVDKMMLDKQREYESLVQQRGALITGYAISTDEVQKTGLDWAKDYEFIEDKTGHGFRLLTEAEKKQRAEAAGQGK